MSWRNIQDLLSDELESSFSDAVVNVARSFQNGTERHSRDADALDNGATHQRRRIEFQVTQVRTDDRAVRIRRILFKEIRNNNDSSRICSNASIPYPFVMGGSISYDAIPIVQIFFKSLKIILAKNIRMRQFNCTLRIGSNDKWRKQHVTN